MIDTNDYVSRQRRFYDERAHDHLQVRSDDLYARNLVDHLADRLGIGPSDRVLEVGAGFGRFTFPLLERCGSVVCVDLSEVTLARLEEERDARGIPVETCSVHAANLDELTPDSLGERFTWIVGFFLLHHLSDYSASIDRMTSLMAPEGKMAFVEPNRRNPLFLLQVMACPDMTWKEEKGMFSLSRKGVEAAYRDAGLEDLDSHSFGFFPPQIFNRLSVARKLERRVESLALAQPLLPFLLMSAGTRNPSEGQR
ncbi:MAG: methyltransferase domain-containing protein [Deltaproteobacteria bacterium]|nr:methyltransferase domain-containing protein [Deltaproteobacteria bacterium]